MHAGATHKKWSHGNSRMWIIQLYINIFIRTYTKFAASYIVVSVLEQVVATETEAINMAKASRTPGNGRCARSFSMHSGGHSQAVASWEFMHVLNSAVANQFVYVPKEKCENKQKHQKTQYIVIISTRTRSKYAPAPIRFLSPCLRESVCPSLQMLLESVLLLRNIRSFNISKSSFSRKARLYHQHIHYT